MNQQNVSEKAKNIVAKFKENTAMTAYNLTVIREGQPGIFDSKFGGVPYWDLAKEYPLDSKGEKMMLLAQINFTEAALEDERLPQKGMLQFFIASESDMYGMDFDEPDSQKDFRIIYHEEVRTDITKEQILALNIPDAASENNEYSPVYEEGTLKITKTTAYMGIEDYRFNEAFAKAVKDATGEELGDQNFYSYFNEEDKEHMFEEISNIGHWILGYPFFSQSDPREHGKNTYYDTLLLQMDSDMVDNRNCILWGDCGVANFFINEEDLRKLDFSKVMYNWDCC